MCFWLHKGSVGYTDELCRLCIVEKESRFYKTIFENKNVS